ncbi:methylmalonyl-CoA mutase family protein [Phenylobacterium sp.]|jgi:methylmalonyl-CoA mutase|uniref:methylmalonyl-CoA mutase family protein n=1 Tax=Phenylobacterium sp. TaxID=1871053 RepID=UPI002E36549D|nr:methylmalonyl-CoA mutase family protein [Phenylobacterium sp.]HEX2558765.1 methylmalonyl-CoA mutase family protein [Phenylobacterium sp.]
MTEVASLAAGFPPASEEAWTELVRKTLKDRPPESLKGATVEALTIEPLYRPAADSRPLLGPRDPIRPWDVRTLVSHPDPARANREILADLGGGAASVIVRIDPTGETGVAVGSAEGLARVLEGVELELAPVALEAGFLGPKAADWLHALAKSSPGARLLFHLDPLSGFAEAGASPGPVESHLIAAATVAARLSQIYPKASMFLASGRVVHEAGGGEAGEIAFAAAAGLAYAKALVRQGLPIDAAFAGLTLGLAADSDVFLSLSKLRAARLVWGRIAQASGPPAQARIEARASQRMLAAKDAWTNMLRLTAAGFAAAAGGADAVVLGCFTDPLGLPTAFARRQSRNAQLVLMEEAHVGRVADPAAGSGYVEALTDQLARAAWDRFQAIEAAGGIVAALASGLIARDVERARLARDAAGKPRIVGVTAFPPEKDAPPEVERVEPRPVDAPSPRLPGPDGVCPPLTPIRLSAPFEAA